ncbi:helix-turn-helix domain-containing protein [Novipirellula sp. SH528]|uniref:helix-turn-helix domain-containing protein n=1 Tax=Novipirellula sp. SH528 TaxID=3454466 RepID=UPI003F9EBC46
MRFGETIREMRQDRKLSQRDLAEKVGVTFTYISKIENHKLDFGQHPSEEMICKLADALGADEDTLLVLAEKIPPQIRQRVIERPEAFRKVAELDDQSLDQLVKQLDRKERRSKKPR